MRRAVAWKVSTRRSSFGSRARFDGVGHAGEVLFGLVHRAGHPVGLEGVDALRPLVGHRVEPEGEEVQPRAEDGEDRGLGRAEAGDAGDTQPAPVRSEPKSLRGIAGRLAILRAS